MRIAVIGKGNVGGGLADLWERAGHELTRVGREGGDVSGAEVVVIAVPGRAVSDALDQVQGRPQSTPRTWSAHRLLPDSGPTRSS